MASCLGENEPEQLSISRAKRLIALDTGKIWVRTALSINDEMQPLQDCEFQNHYSFRLIEDSDTLFYIGADSLCSALERDTLQFLSWQVLGNLQEIFSDSLMFSDSLQNESFRIIEHLTSESMTWSFESNDSTFQESFSWSNPTNN